MFKSLGRAALSNLDGLGKTALTSLKDGIDHGLNLRVDIAVTGLRRAGKTVFIASVIRNLLASAKNGEALYGFDPAIRAVEEVPAGSSDLPPFPTNKYLKDLEDDPPRWPKATDAISRTEINIHYVRNNKIIKKLAGDGMLTLGFIDYPGEWLLDLPLLTTSYEDWSRETLARLRMAPRAAVSSDFLQFLAALDSDPQPNIDELSTTGHVLYKQTLARIRDELGLSFLQPGRFVMPDGKGDRPLLWFFPMEQPEKGRPSFALWSVLADRYKSYGSRIVTPFFQDTFNRCNRQIVLVDLLTALNGGTHTFEDARLALDTAMECLKVRSNSVLAKILPRRFDKVLFGATKADHVPASQRGNLTSLLENMTGSRAMSATSGGAQVDCLSLASICCTQDDKVSLDVGDVDVVVGKPIDGEKRLKIYPGVIPTTSPRSDFWDQERIRYPVFSPPVIERGTFGGIPNINLGRALNFLLKDDLQ